MKKITYSCDKCGRIFKPGDDVYVIETSKYFINHDGDLDRPSDIFIGNVNVSEFPDVHFCNNCVETAVRGI